VKRAAADSDVGSDESPALDAEAIGGPKSSSDGGREEQLGMME
jgi:hypothetical protein